MAKPARMLVPRPPLRLRPQGPRRPQGPPRAAANLPESHGGRPGRPVWLGRGIAESPEALPAGTDRPELRCRRCGACPARGPGLRVRNPPADHELRAACSHPCADSGRRAAHERPDRSAGGQVEGWHAPEAAARGSRRRAGAGRRRDPDRSPAGSPGVPLPLLARLGRQGRAALSLEGSRLVEPAGR